MENCLFCKIIKQEIPSFKVYENKHVYAFLDINAATKYHTLVIPKNHSENSFDANENDLSEVIKAVSKIMDHYKKNLGIHDIQIINSNGEIAQQDIFHTHYHIVPRYAADGKNIERNQTRVLNEELEKCRTNIGTIE